MRFPKPRRGARRRLKQATSKQCDILWSRLVKVPQRCHLKGRDRVKCAGPFQAAHGFSRRYRGTRWDLLNGFCLCAGHHVFYTHHPIEWDDFLRSEWGGPFYEGMKLAALTVTRPDLAQILAALQSSQSSVRAKG